MKDLLGILGDLYHHADKRFLQLITDICELHHKKICDYGKIDDPEGNLRASEELGIPAWKGILLRMNDKMKRLKQFAKTEKLENESFEDSLMDLANYALLALILYRFPAEVLKTGLCSARPQNKEDGLAVSSKDMDKWVVS